MAQVPPQGSLVIGRVIWGDLGGYTSYTSQRGKTIWYPKSPPLNPPSLKQILQRRKFRDAGTLWNYLQQSERDAWSQAARRTNSRLPPYSLFTHYFLFPHDSSKPTLDRAAGEVLNNYPPPPALP